MADGTDQVKWKGKDVTVNLAAPAQDEDSKAAFARWTNDSYWLLAPLKVLDPGVKLTYEGSKEAEGVACEALRLNFEKVGMTPEDQYLLYIDPETKLVRAWDYIPKADTVMHGTWEKYETFGGLKLATEHNFAGKMIRFADIEVKHVVGPLKGRLRATLLRSGANALSHVPTSSTASSRRMQRMPWKQ